MALEDFFTLTEMKDGLATISRVQELMSILRKQQHCTVVGIRDEAREWSTVAGILAATENKSCLDCFMQLDGLLILNHWLVNSLDAVGGPVEEPIRLILGALQKLPLNKERYRKKLISLGIFRTIKQILALENSNVKDSARVLLDRWDFLRDEAGNCQTGEDHKIRFDGKLEVGTVLVEEVSKSPSPLHEASPKEGGVREGYSDLVENESKHLNDNKCTKISEVGSVKDVAVSLPAHCIQLATSNSGDVNVSAGERRTSPCEENASSTMEASVASAGDTGTATYKSPTLEEKNVDFQHHLSQPDATCMSDSGDIVVNTDSMEESQLEFHQEGTVLFGKDYFKGKVQESNLRTEKSESDQVEIHKTPVDTGKRGNSSCHHDAMKTNSIKETNSTIETHESKPDVSLQYGDDALEVAVQVALEAKLEVAERERLSSSPDDNSRDETMDSGGSSSEKSNQTEFRRSDGKADQNDDCDSQGEHNSKLSDNINLDSENSRDQKLTKIVSNEESQQNIDESKCSFDLNEEVCTEELDYLSAPFPNHQNNLSAPVAIVPTLRGTLGLPVTPLHLEGSSGWRGSAATSAFRPASPRRTTETVSGPKQKASFDLNVVDDDMAIAPIFEKQIPVSSGLPSGESSVEVTSAKAERLKLDLNHRIGDENTFQNSSSCWKFQGSPSPASSSNSRQTSMRDFDLNDNPSFSDSRYPNKNRSIDNDAIHGGFKQNDPIVTLMGSKLTVERKEPVSQTQLPFLASRPRVESTAVARPLATAYPHAPAAGYGYLPPAIYGTGSFPYTIDPRVSPLIPQMLGSPVALHAPMSRPSFLVNVSGTRPGLDVVGASRSGLDLNTVSMSLDGGDKEIGNIKQLFLQEANGTTEEQFRTAPQAASGSSVGVKRKEPDCGWGPYSVGYKQVTSWR